MDALARRMEQVEADVECLMCGRTIGQLFGVVGRGHPDRRTSRSVANLTLYLDSQPGAQIRPVQRCESFRCRACGGQGFVTEVLVWERTEKVPEHLCPIHIQRTVHRGRRPGGCRCTVQHAAA